MESRLLHYSKLSRIAYKRNFRIVEELSKLNIIPKIIEIDDLKAYLFNSNGNQIIIIRGSSNIQNWLTNLYVGKTKEGLHKGFSINLNTIYKLLLKEIDTSMNLIVAGHSLGAALGEAFCNKIIEDKIITSTITLYAYGKPKIGNRKYYKKHKDNGLRIIEVINNNDIVSRMPPWWLLYIRCKSKVVYFDKNNNYKEYNKRTMIKDGIGGILLGIKKLKFDPADDHMCDSYIRNIENM